MSESKYSFQYCQKLIVFSHDWNAVLLARRKDEADYDGVYSLIGGKMDTGDDGIFEGLKREKNEEIGPNAIIRVYKKSTHNLYFRKSDSASMILPHFLAQYMGGAIELNKSEYADFKWVLLSELGAFKPKIPTIPEAVNWALEQKQIVSDSDWLTL